VADSAGRQLLAIRLVHALVQLESGTVAQPKAAREDFLHLARLCEVARLDNHAAKARCALPGWLLLDGVRGIGIIGGTVHTLVENHGKENVALRGLNGIRTWLELAFRQRELQWLAWICIVRLARGGYRAASCD
jgi:hypothetical protein